MNVKQLAELAERMRAAQNRYFKARSAEALSQSKQLECELDAAVRGILHPPAPTLFDAFQHELNHAERAITCKPSRILYEHLPKASTCEGREFRVSDHGDRHIKAVDGEWCWLRGDPDR